MTPVMTSSSPLPNGAESGRPGRNTRKENTFPKKKLWSNTALNDFSLSIFPCCG